MLLRAGAYSDRPRFWPEAGLLKRAVRDGVHSCCLGCVLAPDGDSSGPAAPAAGAVAAGGVTSAGPGSASTGDAEACRAVAVGAVVGRSSSLFWASAVRGEVRWAPRLLRGLSSALAPNLHATPFHKHTARHVEYSRPYRLCAYVVNAVLLDPTEQTLLITRQTLQKIAGASREPLHVLWW